LDAQNVKKSNVQRMFLHIFYFSPIFMIINVIAAQSTPDRGRIRNIVSKSKLKSQFSFVF